MFDLIDVFYESPVLWALIVLIVLTGLASRYWSQAFIFPIQVKLKENGEQITKLHTVFENFGHTIHNFDGKMRKQLESVESKVSHLSADLGEARREAHDIVKHVDSLEAKTVAAAAKVDAIKNQVDEEACELKRIDDEIRGSMGMVNSTDRQIDHLEHEIHCLDYQDLHKAGDYDSRRSAIAELESADRKIERLMDETIQIEAGYRRRCASERNGATLAEEYEEHHRKLIDASQHIFYDVRKYLSRAAIRAMEVEEEQIDWSRGELFANTASDDAAKAYHQEVKDYFIKLKEAISRSLKDMAAPRIWMAIK